MRISTEFIINICLALILWAVPSDKLPAYAHRTNEFLRMHPRLRRFLKETLLFLLFMAVVFTLL